MATNEDYEKIRRKYPARITRGKSIKLYCKSQCCCDDMESWKNCEISNCFLWAYRSGKETLSRGKPFKKIRKNSMNFTKNTPSTTDNTLYSISATKSQQGESPASQSQNLEEKE